MSNFSLLKVFLDDDLKNSYLTNINFSMIKNITWVYDYSPSEYEKFNYSDCSTTILYTEPENKIIFNLEIESVPQPIIINCIDSQEVNIKRLQSYTYLTRDKYIDEIIDYPNIDKFIPNLSKNNLILVISYFGYILGYLLNKKLLKV
jgi:hypothetical protein